MSRLLRAASFLLLTGAPVVASAQATNAIHVNIAAGASLPTSDFGTASSTGYNIIAGVGMTPKGSPLGFRVEGIYNQFGRNTDVQDFEGFTDQMAHAGGVTANATYDVIKASTTQSSTLYVIGGVGYYDTRDRFEDQSFQNVGYNIGGGFKFALSGFSAYLEARYHTVSNVGVTFVPISFGLVF
jgi:hypothetical protein